MQRQQMRQQRHTLKQAHNKQKQWQQQEGRRHPSLESLLWRFVEAVTRRNRTLTHVDLRGNGWSIDHQELFAEALNAPRDPPFSSFRLA